MTKILKKTFLMLSIFLIINYISYGFIICLVNIIELNEINKPNIIEFYDRDNNLIYTMNTEYEGEYIVFENINPLLINSFIVIEDKDFYKHSGLDLIRIISAFITNIKHKQIKQGASTISQQVARILYLNNDKNMKRKLKEAYLAIYLEENYSKDKILEIYLNSLFFGGNIYGISKASHFYFNKDQKDLNISECAYLASIINSPNTYLKEEDNHSSLKRKDLVLSLLNKYNYISNQEYNDALNFKLNIIKENNSLINDNIKYYLDSLIFTLKENNIYKNKRGTI